MNQTILSLPSNRVRRNYRGGAGLDRLEGVEPPRDSDRPEDWIASTVAARNPGLEPIPDEGLSFVEENGRRILLKQLFEGEPKHWLGRKHAAKHGPNTGFLAKLLDSSMRLHVQAHPTREFARTHLGSPCGKFETYVILSVREGVEPYIRLGFQHAPSRKQWKRIVLEQDIEAMDRCFERVPVAPGEVFYIPGGVPHAVGEGVTMIEVMEPSDLVVRCEFEREGIAVPPEARFMGLEPALALELFDLQGLSVGEVRNRFSVEPAIVREGGGFREDLLIGPDQTDCFEIRRMRVEGEAVVDKDDRFEIGIVTGGTGSAVSASGNERVDLRPGSKFFTASPATSLHYSVSPDSTSPLEFCLCLPGQR